MNINTLFDIDFYKVLHFEQYPNGTRTVFSNFTPRKLMKPYDYAVFFGINYFISEYLNKNIFVDDRMVDDFVSTYRKTMKNYLGVERSFDHIKQLFEYKKKNGVFPITIKCIEEGQKVLEKVPMLVMYNTDPNFAWFTNYIETIMSATLWRGCMSATIASHFYDIGKIYSTITCDNDIHLKYQFHDFSFRGMGGLESAIISGMAHLHYFSGTDCLPALIERDKLYSTLSGISSIPATEHSVMCAYGKSNEFETYKLLINEIYPFGFLSIVSDTWDFWNVITNYLPLLKNDILNRKGKIVIRPDSGDPVKIICGDSEALEECEKKGLIETLWEIFGGSINSKGYKELDAHIGAIYGDSITLDRCAQILRLLEQKGFASNNIVFGIGSYSYQYNTRDTLGFAIKSTAIEDKNGDIIPIQKDPKTDSGVKKSESGLFVLHRSGIKHHTTWKSYRKDSKDGVMYVAYGKEKNNVY